MSRPVSLLCSLGAVAALASAALAVPNASEAPPVRSWTIDSRPYHIDRIYRSMQGPITRGRIRLGRKGSRELVWVVGLRSEVIDAADGTPAPDGFMCHTNLGFAEMEAHRSIFQPDPRDQRYAPRIFTLSQGQMEVKLPPGFGLPVLTSEPLHLDTQVLNLNHAKIDRDVKIRTTIDYVRDRELTGPMRPLFQKAAQGMVLVKGKDGYFGVADADPEAHGPGCEVGTATAGENQKDPFGREFSAHWDVPPGRQVNRTLVTEFMAIPYDTTVHHIAVHLHPFAESLELRDLTTGISVFKSQTRAPERGIGLDHVDSLSSAEGIPVYADHEYELVSVYDNTSDETQDSMAAMFLYLLDQDFVRPLPAFPLSDPLAPDRPGRPSRVEGLRR